MYHRHNRSEIRCKQRASNHPLLVAILSTRGHRDLPEYMEGIFENERPCMSPITPGRGSRTVHSSATNHQTTSEQVRTRTAQDGTRPMRDSTTEPSLTHLLPNFKSSVGPSLVLLAIKQGAHKYCLEAEIGIAATTYCGTMAASTRIGFIYSIPYIGIWDASSGLCQANSNDSKAQSSVNRQPSMAHSQRIYCRGGLMSGINVPDSRKSYFANSSVA